MRSIWAVSLALLFQLLPVSATAQSANSNLSRLLEAELSGPRAETEDGMGRVARTVVDYFDGAAAADRTALTKEVRDTEQAFAATMAARDHAAFSRHLAEDAVFFAGEKATRGKAAVATAWQALFDGPNPPFSWTPENVEVLDSGALAYSSGPIFDPKGKRVGTFNSVWRREPDGAWRVVFDKGCNACDCVKANGA